MAFSVLSLKIDANVSKFIDKSGQWERGALFKENDKKIEEIMT